MTSQAFEKLFNRIDDDIGDALAMAYVYEEVQNSASMDRVLLRRLNKNALFWNIHVNAVQTSLFIILGRIFDKTKKASSIHVLVETAIKHPELFSLDAVRERISNRRLAPGDFENYLKRAFIPKEADLQYFADALAPYARLFKDKYQPLRHKVYAHRAFNDRKLETALFQNTDRKALLRMVNFLHAFMAVFYQLLYNATRREIEEVMEPSIAKDIKASFQSVLGADR